MRSGPHQGLKGASGGGPSRNPRSQDSSNFDFSDTRQLGHDLHQPSDSGSTPEQEGCDHLPQLAAATPSHARRGFFRDAQLHGSSKSAPTPAQSILSKFSSSAGVWMSRRRPSESASRSGLDDMMPASAFSRSRRRSESAILQVFSAGASPKPREPIVIDNSKRMGGIPGRAKLGRVVEDGTGIHSLLLALQSSIHDSLTHSNNTTSTVKGSPESSDYACARKVSILGKGRIGGLCITMQEQSYSRLILHLIM